MINRNAERKGFLEGLNKMVKDRCSKDEVVIVARSNERFVGRDMVKIASQASGDMVYSQTFGNYTNLEEVSLEQPIQSPIYAVKSSVLQKELPEVMNKAKFMASMDLEKELLFYYLLKKEATTKL